MKTKMVVMGIVLALAVLIVVSLAKSQSVPQLINYQGRLTNAGGQPINGARGMHFALLDGDTATANVLWGETQSSVQVNQGIYNVLLGSGTPIPASALSGNTVYLEVKVGGETLKPRQRLTSVAYAYRAVNAVDSAKLGGQAAGQFYSKTQVDNLLATMQAQIDALQLQTTANTSNISTHTTDISILDGRVTGNDTDIMGLDTRVTAAEDTLADHETRLDSAETKLQPVTLSGTDFIFSGVNVFVRSGSGATDGAVNGLGNLIVGYNENNARPRTGSHNLVVGKYNGYASYGGMVAGQGNEILGAFSTAVGGRNNKANGSWSTVSGGGGLSGPEGNQANGDYSAVGGGTALTVAGAQGWNADSVQINIANLQGQMTTAEGDISNLESKTASMTADADNVYFTNVNVHVRSGSGATTGAINGKGNLIIGYNESNGDTKTGSHNLIVGPNHSYSSYGGVVIGGDNTISGVFASVHGGNQNTASGFGANITGGQLNTASGTYSVVVGGYENRAYANGSAVLGGDYNLAGNGTDPAIGIYSTVSGGSRNTAKGNRSSVSSGQYNIASGAYSFVGGGGMDNSNYHNQAFADYSAILGGIRNLAGDPLVTDHTIGLYSTVVGGEKSSAGGESTAVLGGYWNSATGQYATVSGGNSNNATGIYSSVSGGNTQSATLLYQWVGGTYHSP